MERAWQGLRFLPGTNLAPGPKEDPAKLPEQAVGVNAPRMRECLIWSLQTSQATPWLASCSRRQSRLPRWLGKLGIPTASPNTGETG